MKNFILLITLISIVSCTPSSILNKAFDYAYYEKMDYELLLRADDVSESDLFLLNYAVIRQRDYFNYTIEGKTYGEILSMAKDFDKNGLPVEIKMNDNGAQEKVQVAAVAEGVGFAKKNPNSKRVIKTLNFKCKFDNPSKKDIVLLNSSFIVKGPFGDHLTTVNFEINCILQAETTTDVSFTIPGKVIQKNILFEGNPLIRRLGIDNILNTLTIHPSGISTKDQGKYFNDCFFNAARMEPHNIIEYSKYFKDKEWKNATDGKYVLDFGNMHIPDESDEVIQMR